MESNSRIVGNEDGGQSRKWIHNADTSIVPPAEQFDFYRSWHSDLGDVTLLRDKYAAFTARQTIWQLDNLALVALEYPGTAYHRLWRSKKHPIFDHWVLSIPLTNQLDGGPSQLGKLRWHCLGAPYEAEGNDDGTLALLLPRDFAFTQPFDLTIRPEMAGMIVEYIHLLYRSLPQRTERDVDHIAGATTSLLAACIMPSRNRMVEAEGPINSVIMARAKRLIAVKLAERDLSSEMLCRELNVSRSRLYRIFEPAGGISNYIRRQRLLRTKELLADYSDTRSISSIAEEWGFLDPSTYSRTFRREFGLTPKEARGAGCRRFDRSVVHSEKADPNNGFHLNSILVKTAASHEFRGYTR